MTRSSLPVLLALLAVTSPSLAEPPSADERAPRLAESSATHKDHTAPEAEGRSGKPWTDAAAGNGVALGIGAMPIVSLGAEPGFGTGGSIDFVGRSGPLSGGFEWRLTGSQNIEGNAAVGTLRAGAGLSMCGHLGPAYLCGIGGLARLTALKDPRIKFIEERNPFAGTIGLRPGVEWPLAERFILRAYGEINASLGRPTIWMDGVKYWAAPPISGLVGVGFLIPVRHAPAVPKASASRGRPLTGT